MGPLRLSPRRRRVCRSLGSLVAALVLSLGMGGAARGEPVPVRFVEGVTRGLLLVHSLDGALLGHGDLTQLSKGAQVESRMVLRLRDGSVHDEEVVFTQNKVFALVSYKLAQRGPSFPAPIRVALTTRDGEYVVHAGTGDDAKEHRGRVKLPPDTYNGLLLMLVRNLRPGDSASVHLVAWTPKPRLIGMDLVPVGEDAARVGEESRSARRYELRPRLGVLLSIAAKIMGKTPETQRCWVLVDPVPAFVACEAQLAAGGPMWRIGVVSPAQRTAATPR